MNKRLALSFLFAAVLTCPASVLAQEKGQIGITMGYPESIGLMWHLTDDVAVRPEFSFRHGTTGLGDDDSTTGVGVGVSGIIYISKRDALRTYVSPRFTYTRVTSEIDTSLSLVDVTRTLPSLGLTVPSSVTSTSTSKSFRASFGAQYALHERFSIFGEVGVSYTRADFSSGFDDQFLGLRRPNGPHTTSTATAAGVVFYFNH